MLFGGGGTFFLRLVRNKITLCCNRSTRTFHCFYVYLTCHDASAEGCTISLGSWVVTFYWFCGMCDTLHKCILFVLYLASSHLLFSYLKILIRWSMHFLKTVTFSVSTHFIYFLSYINNELYCWSIVSRVNTYLNEFQCVSHFFSK